MKILIVDDDAVSRTMLERLMADVGECVAVSSGTMAITSFANEWKSQAPFDVVMMDVTMPEVDGRVALSTIRSFEKQKNVPKEKKAIVLMVTGHSDKDTIVSCVKAGCDDYITKPLDKGVILRKLEKFGFDLRKRKENLRQTISEIIEKFRKGTIDLPVLPKIAQEIQGMMDSPTSTVEDLSRIIEKDGVISLKLISTVNSPFYRGAEKVTSVKNAVQRVGFKETQSIVSAIANKSLYQARSREFQNLMERLWTHSLATAYGSKAVARKVGVLDEEKVFFVGLLHDIGKALLIRALDEISSQGPPLSPNDVISVVHEVHTSFGAAILRKWGFPDTFVRVAREHEDVSISEKTATEILIVDLANRLSRRIGFSLFGEESGDPTLESASVLQIAPGALGVISEEMRQVVTGLQGSLQDNSYQM